MKPRTKAARGTLTGNGNPVTDWITSTTPDLTDPTIYFLHTDPKPRAVIVHSPSSDAVQDLASMTFEEP